MYNGDMKLRLYSWIEFAIWLLILCLCILGIRYHHYKKIKALPTYQIFISDVDGMIVGSPVRYQGVQVGYIKTIKLLQDTAYVRFVITHEDLKLPKGVIATVEFSGLGGSKSLELYAPDKNETSQKIIIVKDPTRLNDSISLFNLMFDKIDSISLKATHFGKSIGFINENQIDIKTEDIGENINQAEKFLDNLINTREKFINKFKPEQQTTINQE